MMIDLKDLMPAEIDRFCVERFGQRPGQGLRAADQLFRMRREDIGSWTGLNRAFREQLKAGCSISVLNVETVAASADGTRKLLYRLHDGATVEGVLIPGPGRLTLCLSTQVGCASGCGFCLTGSGGLIRNLAVAEIVNQVFAAERAGGSISNLVLMGTGEPLANYAAVRAFTVIATDRHGMGYSPKRVTVSTCGLAPMIERMADDRVPASLAVSLNATTDEVRDRIMPVNRTWPVARLLQAMRAYADATGRTVTIEYALFQDVNDSVQDAKRLVALTDGLPCMINLLLFNPFPGSPFRRPADERLSVFRDVLVRAGRIAVVRKSRGIDVGAACGQLRAGLGPSARGPA